MNPALLLFAVALIASLLSGILGWFCGLYWLIPLAIVLIALGSYLLIRLLRFYSRLKELVKDLREGDFGVSLPQVEKGPLGALLAQLAGAIKRTGEFEKLRQSRVLLYYRALNLLLREIKEPVIWIDTERDFFRLNPEAQRLFEVDQDEYKLSGILNLPDNEVFSTWFKRLIYSSDVVPEEIACDVALPVSKHSRMLYVKALVVRTGEEVHSLIFLFLKPV